MKMSVENFMPILFKVLFGFIILNMIVNFILLYIKNKRMYKLLALYWPVVLFVFIMQSSFQEGNLPVTFAYSSSIISMSIFAMIGLEAIGRKFPAKRYFLYFIGFFPLTYFLGSKGYSFAVVAMPFAIATATPLLHAFIYIHFIDRRKTTRLQKVLGCVYFIMAIHCINFALFRMNPGAQLWGWLTAYAIYDMLAILLPSIALEEANMSENERLQNLVNDKTADLNKFLKENEGLLKVLLHDISNPLMVMRYYLSAFNNNLEENDILIEKVKKSHVAMESIVQQVKEIYGQKAKKTKIPLNPVVLEECFNEVSFIFAQSLERKNVSLKFNNLLSPDTKVMADKTSLTHSVLSNLVSNGLKFSAPNTEIEVTATEESDAVIVEIKDKIVSRFMWNELS